MSSAYVFPGQGSQAVGMGKALAETFPVARRVFDEVDEALGDKLTTVMWEGPAETLTLTENTQPALVAVSLAAMRVLESEAGVDLKRDAKFVAGHSVGEYAALAAAGSLSVADAVRLVRIRGRAMQRAVPVGMGAMAALLGVDFEQAAAIAAEAAQGELVQAANDNGGGQVVVSGHKTAVERAVEVAKAKGVRRAMLLPVSAPFHSALMQPAAEVMAEALGKVTIKPPVVPLVANVTAAPVTDPAQIRARAGRAGHRHGALARVGCIHGGRRRHAFLRSRLRQGSRGTGQADRRRCGGRVDRHAGRCRRLSRPRAADDLRSRTYAEESAYVRSVRQDRAGDRSDRRHRRRDRARAASAGCDGRALRDAGGCARRARRRN